MDNTLENLKKINYIKIFLKRQLDNLDKSKSNYEELYNKNTDIDINYEDESIVFKKNKKILYSNRYSTLGIFHKSTKVWLWSWAMSDIQFDETKEARKILDYGLKLEPNLNHFNNTQLHYYIKAHLINSRIFFENDILFDIHLGLALYISKAEFIYNIENDDIIYYYLVF